MVAASKLKHHPDNPRLGDVDAIEASIRRFGWYGNLQVQKSTGFIVKGNNALEAGLRIGFTSFPVVFLDISDDDALGILITDNRTSDLAHYHPPTLGDALTKMAKTSRGLEGTGFEPPDVARVLDSLVKKTPPVNELDQAVQLRPPSEYAVISCADAEEWDELKAILRLGPVRRGGYKAGSAFDDQTGTQRVVPFPLFLQLITP